MNNVKAIQKLSETELKLGVSSSKKSWHDMYSGSAYVFIGGLDYGLTEGDIISIFSQYGEIVNINLVRDKKTGKSKGYCFLCYEDQRSTILAVDNFNAIKVCGRTIRVDHVAEYRRPKDEHGNEIIEKGCVPKTPTPSPTPSESPPPSGSPSPKHKKKKKKKMKKMKKEKKAQKTKEGGSSFDESDRESLHKKSQSGSCEGSKSTKEQRLCRSPRSRSRSKEKRPRSRSSSKEKRPRSRSRSKEKRPRSRSRSKEKRPRSRSRERYRRDRVKKRLKSRSRERSNERHARISRRSRSRSWDRRRKRKSKSRER